MRVVDVHTHGLGGIDTRTENWDDILKIAELQGSYGTTDMVPTIYPGPIGTMRKNMMAVKEAMKKQQLTTDDQRSEMSKSKLARIVGIHLEGPFLNPLKPGVLDGTVFQEPSETTWKRLIEGFEDIVRIVTIAPELKGAEKLIKIISNMGIIVSLGHSDATYEETEKAFHAGAKSITHLFNAMRSFHHREPGIAGFGLMNQSIYIEVIADPFHLNVHTLEFIFKIKNAHKILIISDSVNNTKAMTPRHALQNDGGILQGGSMTMRESAMRLIRLGFNKDTVIACVSANPLSYLSLSK